MSTVKSKKLQVGTDASASNNFTIYQPATPDGTLRIGVGNADSPTEVGRFDSNGYVATNAPAFSAYANAGASISAGTWTKVPMNVERFDTNNCYDTTNYRFTPNVAGYYQFNGAMGIGAGGSAGYFLVGLYKNGSAYTYGSNYPAHSANGPNSVISSLIYMNGSTDYVELYVVSAVSGTTYSDSFRNFDGHLVRAV